MIPQKFLEKINREQRETERIKEYDSRIAHEYDPIYYKNKALMVRRIGMPNWFFDEIVVKGVGNVKEVAEKQLFYVSNHKSLADFLVHGYVFWLCKLPVPRFLAGENLNRIVLGNFFRKCGAIFIDRNEKDRFYWNFEDAYIKEVFLNGENLLVYPEGTRKDNLSEKLKTGTFGQMTYAVKEGRDAFIVPTYVDYDKRIEEWVMDKVRENKEKRDELTKISKGLRAEGKNLRAWLVEFRAKIRDKIYFDLDLFAYFVRLFVKNKGNVYVYFGKAFSIKEFLNSVSIENEVSEKVALSQKALEEIVKLENIYKASKIG